MQPSSEGSFPSLPLSTQVVGQAEPLEQESAKIQQSNKDN